MEQKDYKLEIIAFLLKGENHLREIARALNTNHMMISRKLKVLSKENVLDFKTKGKNKIYFLKKSIEAKSYVFMAEEYKLIKILQKYPYLRLIIEKIQNNSKLKLALLFGSYAKKLAKEESDIDVYIETTDKKVKQKIESIDSKLSIKIGEFDQSNLLIKEIIKNNIILKGIEEYYEKLKFFN